MLAKFRHHYPQGSIISELINLDRGLYLVKVTVRVAGEILATGLAAAERVELAEDRARERAIAALALETIPAIKSEVEATETNTNELQESETPKLDPPKISVANSTKVEPKPELPSQQSVTPTEPAPAEFPSTAFTEEIAIPEPASDFSPPETETPVVENGNLFAGTYEAQSPPEPIEPPQPDTDDSVTSEQSVEMSFEDIKHQTDIHIKRLGWTKEDGVNFLKSRYGKRSRFYLKDEELREFLQYLESQPTPN